MSVHARPYYKVLNMKQLITWFIRYLLFPTLLAIGTALMLVILENKQNPEVWAMLISSIVIGLVMLAERILPYQAEWNKAQGDTVSDLSSLAVILLLLEPLMKVLSAWLLSLSLVWLSQLSTTNLFPNHWPLLMQLTLFAVTAEFGRYWMHRLSHSNLFLWRFHASHHSAERLYQFNGYRIHPVNHLWNYFFGQFPLILLGAGGEVLILYFVFSSIVAAFQHANIDSHHGLFNYLFSTNELHRWHHTKDRSIGHKNHGSVLILWDIVFNSYFDGKDHASQDNQVSQVGLFSAKRYPINSYWKQLFVPFCWKRCVEETK